VLKLIYVGEDPESVIAAGIITTNADPILSSGLYPYFLSNKTRVYPALTRIRVTIYVGAEFSVDK
jgi:hypothetical protein